uniref:Uncharacterized protein n=1 Tax=viral metagenome TaxID=1070528 RepID=A0A6C0I0J1_9ZZZZ
MNFLLSIDNYNLDNVHFLESKHNMIMDGNFTKIFYSNSFIIINNIFIDFEIVPINIQELNTNNQYNNIKYIMYFDIYENTEIIKKIIEIEENILNYYLKYNGINKTCEYILKNQIFNKNFKFYRNNKNLNEKYGKFFLKISGIWENNTKIGITYKIVEYFV